MMNHDLFMAILALDSHNREYDPGIKNLGGPGSIVGGGKVLSIPLPSGSEAASFSASAYEVGDSDHIVISYRGTDNPSVDIWTGWTAGTGLPTSQVRMAAEFYYAVKDAYPDKTITLTGHSLGGGPLP